MVQNLLVTGAAGFIGCNFVRLVLKEDIKKIVVLDKLTYAGNKNSLKDCEQDSRFQFVEGDIADEKCVSALFAKEKFDAVVNFAAETHVDRSIDGPAAFIQTNFVGTFQLLEAARHNKVSRFLHVSTDEVYGTLGETGLFEEETPYAPNSPYSATKAGADHLVRAYHETYGMFTLITNCSNNYGPYQFPEKLIPLMILNALEKKKLPVYGDGLNVRDWLYVEDHCEGILTVLKNGQSGEKYNIGGHNEWPNIKIVERICSVLQELAPPKESGFQYKSLISFVKDRPGHDRRYAIDASKIKKELGWEPKHNFESGIKKTIQWYLDNKEWCQDVQSGNYQRERLGINK